jgi:hypothetical protein
MAYPEQPHASLSLRQKERRIGVERQGLALGAARERSRLAVRALYDREQQSNLALEDWENEGGPVAG